MEPPVKNKKYALDSLGLKALPVAFHFSKKQKVPIAFLRVGKTPRAPRKRDSIPALPNVEATLVHRRSVDARNFAVIQLMKKRELKDHWFQQKVTVRDEQYVPLELKFEYS